MRILIIVILIAIALWRFESAPDSYWTLAWAALAGFQIRGEMERHM
jgi:hypothetical protein